mgnify:CR=1 FL=1
MKGKWTVALTLASMAFAAMPPALWRLHESQTTERLGPAWERRLIALAIVVALVPAVALLVAAVRRTLRLAIVLPLVLLVLVGVLGGFALVVVTSKGFPLDDEIYLRTEPLEPEQLHLYLHKFLGCTVTVYAGAPGALYVRPVHDAAVLCDQVAQVRASRSADGTIELTGGGTPKGLLDLFFGPH